jgi:hypothetical protein
LGGVTFFLALLSKEMAVAGLLVVPALDWLSTRRLYWRRYAPLLLGSIAYFALPPAQRRRVGWRRAGARRALHNSRSICCAVGFYGVRSLVPVRLCAYVPTVPDAAIYLAAGVLLPLAGAGLLYRAWRQARWPLVFLLVWFALTLAPSLTVIVRRSGSAPVADRYLYVPSVATCISSSAVVSATRRQRLSARWPLMSRH